MKKLFFVLFICLFFSSCHMREKKIAYYDGNYCEITIKDSLSKEIIFERKGGMLVHVSNSYANIVYYDHTTQTFIQKFFSGNYQFIYTMKL